MNHPTRLRHDYWWTCFPAIPPRREDARYPCIMRLYADHTLNGLKGDTGRSVYRHGGEDHLVLSFFENFVLDEKYLWVRFIAERLGMADGPVAAANWSYAFEERISGERRPRIADLVLHWRDRSGEAVVVIEAKRPGVRRGDFKDKDDPRRNYYLRYTAMRDISRTRQMLLISEKDREKINANLWSDPRVVTWEELARVQIEIFEQAAPASVRATLGVRLLAHHFELGLAGYTDWQVSPDWAVDLTSLELPNKTMAWLKGSESYFATRYKKAVPVPPFEWLRTEPSAPNLLGAKRQSTRDREMPLWRSSQ